MDLTVIDYGAGNTQSVVYAFERFGVKPIVTDDIDRISKATHVVLPGVGHALPAMNRIKDIGLDKVIPNLSQPVLGICLGMQLLCRSTEEGGVEGIGVFDSVVKRFDIELNVPHTGWNEIHSLKSPLFDGLSNKSHVYFVHSYFAELCRQTNGIVEYGLPFSAALQNNNFYGCQFHPEKSGAIGDLILKNFLSL